MNAGNLIYITLDKSVPFLPDESQFIYIEREHDGLLETKMMRCVKVCNNHKSDLFLFGKFVFIPELLNRVCSEIIIDYYNPSHRRLKKIENPYGIIVDHIVEKENVRHGILHYVGTSNSQGYVCSYIDLASDFDERIFDELLMQIGFKDKQRKSRVENANLMAKIIESSAGHDIRFSIAPSGKSKSDEEKEETLFRIDLEDEKKQEDEVITEKICTNKENEKAEIGTLMYELKERVKKLEQKGISLALIMEMLGGEIAPKKEDLSRIIVDARYRIFLPGFADMEVKMTPLVRTVYIFFLKHPQGIAIKSMSSYFNEMLSIYKHITPYGDEDQIVDSIRLLCDPTDNSINEKCSRIKLIFKTMFTKEIASEYYVSGGRGEDKYIRIAQLKGMVTFLSNNYKNKEL